VEVEAHATNRSAVAGNGKRFPKITHNTEPDILSGAFGNSLFFRLRLLFQLTFCRPAKFAYAHGSRLSELKVMPAGSRTAFDWCSESDRFQDKTEEGHWCCASNKALQKILNVRISLS